MSERVSAPGKPEERCAAFTGPARGSRPTAWWAPSTAPRRRWEGCCWVPKALARKRTTPGCPRRSRTSGEGTSVPAVLTDRQPLRRTAGPEAPSKRMRRSTWPRRPPPGALRAKRSPPTIPNSHPPRRRLPPLARAPSASPWDGEFGPQDRGGRVRRLPRPRPAYGRRPVVGRPRGAWIDMQRRGNAEPSPSAPAHPAPRHHHITTRTKRAEDRGPPTTRLPRKRLRASGGNAFVPRLQSARLRPPPGRRIPALRLRRAVRLAYRRATAFQVDGVPWGPPPGPLLGIPASPDFDAPRLFRDRPGKLRRRRLHQPAPSWRPAGRW